jgi:lipoate-protein ligase A
MIWRFINSGFNSGDYNMNFDISLAENLEQDAAIFRLYRWKPYCISLGANQDISSINKNKADSDGIDVVKRPTGGRAILHSEELTYSVIYPVDGSFSPRQLYNEINSALKTGLTIYDPVFYDIELEKTQPDFGTFYNQKISELCFAVSAKSELKFDGKKLAGSAQRKLDKSILQHGSILCGDHHLKIVDYLDYSSEEIPSIKNEIAQSTIDIKSIINHNADYDFLADSLKAGMEKHFDMKFDDHTSFVENNMMTV